MTANPELTEATRRPVNRLTRSKVVERSREKPLNSRMRPMNARVYSPTQPSKDLLSDPSFFHRVVAHSRAGHFAACVTRGALVEGHLLLVPCFQSKSIAEATSWRKRHDEYLEFAELITGMLQQQFGETVFRFEHGMNCFDDGGSCGTSHAHMHMLPLNENLCDEVTTSVQARISPWTETDNLNLCRTFIEDGNSYLLCGSASDRLFVHRVSQQTKSQSQLFRRLIASALDEPERWDWSLHDNTENVIATQNRLGTISPVKARSLFRGTSILTS